MDCKKLVSVIILSYNNYNFIKNAIISVLNQTYEHIEIIISDDESADFFEEDLRDFINLNKNDNIIRIVINRNSQNLGTVKNMNIALKLTQGDYIIPFAADDQMYHKDVVKQFVWNMDRLKKDEYILTTQVGMYDYTLTQFVYGFVAPKHIELLRSRDSVKLYDCLVKEIFIPSCGTAYKKEFFTKYGFFDENYVLVEDWSRYLQLVRDGVVIKFCDFMSFMHRDGGVSHGNNAKNIKLNTLFNKDMLRTYEKEILPYKHLLSMETQKEVEIAYRKYQKLVDLATSEHVENKVSLFIKFDIARFYQYAKRLMLKLINIISQRYGIVLLVSFLLILFPKIVLDSLLPELKSLTPFFIFSATLFFLLPVITESFRNLYMCIQGIEDNYYQLNNQPVGDFLEGIL